MIEEDQLLRSTEWPLLIVVESFISSSSLVSPRLDSNFYDLDLVIFEQQRPLLTQYEFVECHLLLPSLDTQIQRYDTRLGEAHINSRYSN